MASGSKRKSTSPMDGKEAPEEGRRRPGVLGADLLRGLQNPDVCDITLLGSDGGGGVPAVRSILAMRSAVLERMLLGNFRESSSDEVQLPYPREVLRCVVEYCCSDEVGRFNALSKDDGRDFDAVRLAVHTLAAADFLELNGLHSWLETMLKELMNEKPTYSCSVWDESLKHTAPLENVRSAALDMIHKNPSCISTGVLVLSPEGLHSLVEDDMLRLFALDLFRSVKKWYEKGFPGLDAERRLEVAKSCTSKIDLSLIPPKDILGTVRDSGLADCEKMLEVLAEKARSSNMPWSDDPTAVYVTGAGSSCVNGVYRKTKQQYFGMPTYAKQGLLDGQMVTFDIQYRRDTSASNSWWQMSASLDSQAIGRAFYYAFVSESSGSELKSDMQWGKYDVGRRPAPSVRVPPTW